MKPFGFPKNERLCSKKTIDLIFESGENTFAYPIKVSYTLSILVPYDIPEQIMIVVPKKKFKRAVHRNAIRRKMREAYRLNKHLLLNSCLENGKSLRIAFIYIASEQLNYQQILDATQKVISLLMERTQKTD